jgi:hypothetical protein
MQNFIYTASLCEFYKYLLCRNFGRRVSVSTGLPCSSKPGGVGIVFVPWCFILIVIELETAEILPAASEATAVIIVPTATGSVSVYSNNPSGPAITL